jgi:hypothetical protein
MERPIAYSGCALTVVFAVCQNGESPGERFYDELDEKDQAKMLKLFTRMGEVGKIANRENFKKIENDLWEFKNHQIRMPCFFRPGKIVVVTHGFIKKGDAIPRPQIARAYRIQQEDIANESGGHGLWCI